MSILNVNQIQPVGSGQTITISASDITASSATITASKITASSGDFTVGTGSSVYSPTTNTLALGTNSAERVRITSGGNVGINETSPQYQLHVHDDTAYHGIFVNGNDAPRITFARSTTTTGEWSVGIDGTNGNNFAINNSADNSNNKIIISSSQISLYGNTYVGGNVIIPSGNGIDFSATSDASGSTSELLDDYEEGTWTPTLNGFTNAGIFQTAEYIKIGRKVTVYLNIFQSSNNMSFTATSLISGLPFTTIANFHTAVSAVAVDVSENTDIIAAWLSPTTPVVKLKTASSSRRHILLQVSYYTTT